MSFITNKTVVLTGASSGVGQALALQLAEAGAHLLLSGRSRQKLAQTLRLCNKKSAEAQYDAHHSTVAGSLACVDTAYRIGRLARERGNLGGFIHCAGYLAPGPAIWEISPREFGQVMDASLTGAWQLIRFLVPLLLDRDSTFAAFVGSGSAEIVQPGIAAYCVAKAGEEHLARQLAGEAPNIISFVYRPGIVDTPMQAEARSSTGLKADELRPVFGGWKDKGQLISAENSARGLMQLLNALRPEMSGKTFDVRSLPDFS